MDIHIWVLVLSSAILHASWNALVKSSSTPHLAMAAQAVITGLICAGFIPFVPLPSLEVVPIIIAAATVHVAYNFALASAYKIGDFGLVYPIARGGAPLIVLTLSFFFFRETPSPTALAAILLIIAGIAILAFRSYTSIRDHLKATSISLATGALIALYTVLDGWGARVNQDPHSFIVWLFFTIGLFISPFLFFKWQNLLKHAIEPQLSQNIVVRTTIGAVLGLAGFWIVVWALSQSPMGPVSALRETSIIIAAIISTVILKEPFGMARVLSTILVAAGVVLMGLTVS